MTRDLEGVGGAEGLAELRGRKFVVAQICPRCLAWCGHLRCVKKILVEWSFLVAQWVKDWT